MNATQKSILEQFGYWQRAIDDERTLPSLDKETAVAVLGCGTSYYLAQSLAAVLSTHGWRAVAVPGGEWQHRADAYIRGEQVQVVALSRSGETTETVLAAKESVQRGYHVIGITCAPGSPLAAASSEVLELQTSPHEGIVMTSSASLMLLLGFMLAGEAIPSDLPEQAERLLSQGGPKLEAAVSGRSHVVFLGSGELYGIAQEGALKLQEMSLSYTQAYHPLEYRHGPVALLDERTMVVMLHHPDPQAYPGEEALVKELQAKGATVLSLGTKESSSLVLPELSPALTGLVSLPVLQRLGETVAQSKGLDTTAPRNLTKVVMLQGAS